jgi:hypothetical protein
MYPPFTLEMALVKATRVVALEPIERLIARVDALGRGDEPGSTQRPIATRRDAGPAPAPVTAPTSQSAGRAVETRAVDAAAAGSGPVDADRLWTLVLQRVANEKPNLESYLRGGRPVAAGAGELVVEYGSADVWAADLASREDNQSFVARVLRDVAGRDLTFRIRRNVDSPAGGAAPAAERPVARADAESASVGREGSSRRAVVAEVLAHPAVKDALEIFEGEVMDVRDLSELRERRDAEG